MDYDASTIGSPEDYSPMLRHPTFVVAPGCFSQLLVLGCIYCHFFFPFSLFFLFLSGSLFGSSIYDIHLAFLVMVLYCTGLVAWDLQMQVHEFPSLLVSLIGWGENTI